MIDPAFVHVISQPEVLITSYVEILTIFGIFAVLGSIITWWHHVNCIEKGCWRKGHPSPDHGHPVCRKHTDHPHPAFG